MGESATTPAIQSAGGSTPGLLAALQSQATPPAAISTHRDDERLSTVSIIEPEQKAFSAERKKKRAKTATAAGGTKILLPAKRRKCSENFLDHTDRTSTKAEDDEEINAPDPACCGWG